MNLKFILLGIFQRIKFPFQYLVGKNFSDSVFIKNCIDMDSVIVDIGSNVGSFIELVNKYSRNYFIHSIEPNIELINFQEKKFHNLKNIKFHNLAISQKNGEASLYLRSPSSHSSLYSEHIDENFNKEISTKRVKTTTLNNFLKSQNINKVNLLKIDTEGAELDILNSSKDLILNGVIKFIKIEVSFASINSIFEFSKNTNLKVIGVNNIFHFENSFRYCDVYLENTN